MTIAYEFETKPAAGKTMQVADGLHWLRMPLPMELANINLWLLEKANGWSIVDTGSAVSRALREAAKDWLQGMIRRQPQIRNRLDIDIVQLR